MDLGKENACCVKMNLNFIQGISEKIYNTPKTQDSVTFFAFFFFFKEIFILHQPKKLVQKTKFPVMTLTVHLSKIRMLKNRKRKNKKGYLLQRMTKHHQ